jgi:tRNA uridine 5-carboxymethylaminomethyl modification enzyme
MTLRSDNADLRLTRKGWDAGVVSQERREALLKMEIGLDETAGLLKEIQLSPNVSDSCIFWLFFQEFSAFINRNGRHMA